MKGILNKYYNSQYDILKNIFGMVFDKHAPLKKKNNNRKQSQFHDEATE